MVEEIEDKTIYGAEMLKKRRCSLKMEVGKGVEDEDVKRKDIEVGPEVHRDTNAVVRG